jgi:hypothetical protein
MTNDEETALHEKLKGLGVDELLKYESASKFLIRFINIIGISLFVYLLYFPILPVVIGVGLLAFVLSQMSVGVSKTLIVIRSLLDKTQKT